MRKHIVLIIILSLIALWPFFKQGFFESHDGGWMVIRFSAFHQTLAGGQFPVRFVDRLNNNYGYPVVNFLYPLPFYLAEVPKVLGFNFVDSVKTVFVISTVFSVVAMFWAISQFFTRYASLAGAVIYLFAPYRFVDLYVRGSLGENVAFAIAPIILGSIFRIAKNQKEFLPILSVSIALLVISHNVLAIIFIPMFFLLSILLVKKDILRITAAFLVGLLISSFFWLPAIYDLQFVKLSQIKVSNVSSHLSSVEKLIFPSWGFGQTPQQKSGLSTQFGLVSLAVFIASTVLFLTSKSKEKIIGVLLILYVTIFIIMTNFSLPFWQIPFVDIIQFPWRLLSLIVFISSLLAAFVVDSIKKNKLIVAMLLILASVISTIVYARPLKFVDRDDSFYSTNEDTTTARDEYLPLWVKEKPLSRANQKIEIEGGEIISSGIKAANYKANVNIQKETKVRVNTIYFPGWRAFINGQKANVIYQDNPNGLMSFKLPKGEHEVIIKYSKTPVHLVSEIASLIALIGAGSYFFISWRKRNS